MSTPIVRSNDVHTTIARGVKVEGNLASQGNVLVEGDVQGTIQIGGLLTIGQEAKINANVNAQEAVISGSVEGNIVIAKRLELKAAARILGDIQAEALTVETGASINGRVAVGAKPTSSVGKPNATAARKDTRPLSTGGSLED